MPVEGFWAIQLMLITPQWALFPEPVQVIPKQLWAAGSFIFMRLEARWDRFTVVAGEAGQIGGGPDGCNKGMDVLIWTEPLPPLQALQALCP